MLAAVLSPLLIAGDETQNFLGTTVSTHDRTNFSKISKNEFNQHFTIKSAYNATKPSFEFENLNFLTRNLSDVAARVGYFSNANHEHNIERRLDGQPLSIRRSDGGSSSEKLGDYFSGILLRREGDCRH